MDASGAAQIESSAEARLDMRSGKLLKAVVNLPVDSTGPAVGTGNGSKIAISLEGPKGAVTGRSDKIRFLTTPGQADFSEVTYFLTAETWDEYVNLIRDGVQRYGIDQGAAESWISSIGANRSDRSDFALGPGTATGLAVTYDLRYGGVTAPHVIIVHVNAADGRAG